MTHVTLERGHFTGGKQGLAEPTYIHFSASAISDFHKKSLGAGYGSTQRWQRTILPVILLIIVVTVVVLIEFVILVLVVPLDGTLSQDILQVVYVVYTVVVNTADF